MAIMIHLKKIVVLLYPKSFRIEPSNHITHIFATSHYIGFKISITGPKMSAFTSLFFAKELEFVLGQAQRKVLYIKVMHGDCHEIYQAVYSCPLCCHKLVLPILLGTSM